MANFILHDPNTNFVVSGNGSNLIEKIVHLSSILKNQVPEFMKEDYPKFVAFLEAYYEWMERKNQVLFESKKVLINQDIDKTIEEFVEFFRTEFMVDIPKNVLTDKRNLVKNIKQFYRARGTEKSFQLLFRILYNKDLDFYYPREDIFKSSDGKWIQEKSLKVKVITGDPFQLLSKKIKGLTSLATGTIENIVRYENSSYEVYELFLAPLSIMGVFVIGELIEFEDIVCEIYPVVTGIEIIHDTVQRNIWTYSEPITNAGIFNSPGVTFRAATVLTSFAGEAVYGDNSMERRCQVIPLDYTVDVTYTLSCYVKMDDNSKPNSGTETYRDFVFTQNNQWTPHWGTNYKYQHVGNNVWRVYITFTFSGVGGTSVSLTKGSGNGFSNKGFVVSGFQIEVGSELTSYQKVSNYILEAYDRAGLEYEEDEEVFLFDTSGTNAKAKIKTVDKLGRIKFVEILNSGINYSENTQIVFPFKDEQAVAEPIIGALFTYPGYYLNEDGQLSTTKFLQDSYFYQQFSYVLLIDESINKYKEIVKKILHPCGLIMFGGVRFIDLQDMSFEIIGENMNFKKYELEFKFYLSMIMNAGNHFPELARQLYTLISYSIQDENSQGFGPSFRTIERFKSNFLPSPFKFPLADNWPHPNEDYFEDYGNTQVKDLFKIQLEDLFHQQHKHANFLPDAYFAFSLSLSSLLSAYQALVFNADYDFNTNVNDAATITEVPDTELKRKTIYSPAVTGPIISRSDLKENLISSSETLTHASVIKSGLTVSGNQIVNPIDGATDVSKLIEAAGSSEKYIEFTGIRYIENKQFILSGYAKANSRNWLHVVFDPSAKANCNVVYNLSTRSVYTSNDVDYGNIHADLGWPTGWIKFELAFTPSTNVSGYARIYISDSRTTKTFTGDGTSGAYIWGLHLRKSSSTQTYIETTGNQIQSGFKDKKVGYFTGTQSLSFDTRKNLINYSEPLASTGWVTPDAVTFQAGTVMPIAKGEVYPSTNYLTRSEEFSHADWVKTSCTVTADTHIAPDGSLSADKVIEAAATSDHNIRQSKAVVSGTEYSFTLYVKQAERTFVQLSTSAAGFGTARYANFNLTNGVIGTIGADTTATCVSDQNGYYKCQIKMTASASTSTLVHACILTSNTDANDFSYLGDGTSGIYVWGASFKETTNPDVYVQTTTTMAIKGEVYPITNLLTYSEDFSNVIWVKPQSTVVSNSILAPDGTLTADTLLETAVTNYHSIYQFVNVTSGLTYSMAVRAKKQNRSVIQIQGSTAEFSATTYANFDLDAGVLGTVGAGTRAYITDLDDDWYLCEIIAAATSTATAAFNIHTATSPTAALRESYLGVITDGVYIWGAQVRQSNTPTTYVKTTDVICPLGEGVYAGGATYRRLRQGVSGRTNTDPYTISFYVKMADNSKPNQVVQTYRDFFVERNNGYGLTYSNYVYEDMGNGVWRVSHTAIDSTATTFTAMGVTTEATQGTGKAFLISGFQVEQAGVVSSYQQMRNSTNNEIEIVDEYINNNSGTTFVVFSPYNKSQSNGIIIKDSNDKFKIYVDSGYLKIAMDDGSVHTINKNIISGDKYLLRVKHDSGVLKVSLNGDAESVLTLGNIASVSGYFTIGTGFVGKIARVVFNENITTIAQDLLILEYFNLLYDI